MKHALAKKRKTRSPISHPFNELELVHKAFYLSVTEATVESVAAWQQRQASVSSMPVFGDWFARMMPLVESGRREFYTIEE